MSVKGMSVKGWVNEVEPRELEQFKVSERTTSVAPTSPHARKGNGIQLPKDKNKVFASWHP